MSEVSYLLAFIGGLITFLSPCILPVVIPYMTFLTGSSLDQLTSRNGAGAGAVDLSMSRVMLTATAFVTGFSVVFLIFGGLIIQLSGAYRENIATIGGVIVVIMGLHFMHVFRLGFLERDIRVPISEKPGTLVGDFLVGAAFSAGWTPCIGIIFSGIMSMALSQESSAQGLIVLFLFTAGMALPFLLAAAFTGRFLKFFSRFRKHLGIVEKSMGIFMILIGVLILSGKLTVLNIYLLEFFPEPIFEQRIIEQFG